jgi:hypothetical protein
VIQSHILTLFTPYLYSGGTMPSKLPSPNKPTKHIKAQSVTVPKKSAAKKAKKVQNVKPHRTPLKAAKKFAASAKRDAAKYVITPDPVVTAKRTAKKVYKKPVVESFINAAAVTSSVAKAVQLAEDVSYQEGLEMMQSPDVQTAIAGRRMTLAAECGITSQKVMSHFAAMGFSNMKRYGALLMADSVVAELAEMSDDDAAAIQELTTETYWDEQAEKEVKRVKIKLYPKGAALEKMAQHLGIKGFGGPLAKAGIDRVGVQTVVAPDGTVTTTAIVQQLSDEQIEDMLLGVSDEETYSERTE